MVAANARTKKAKKTVKTKKTVRGSTEKSTVKVTFDLDIANAKLLKDVEAHIKEDVLKKQGVRLTKVNKESLLNFCISAAHTALKLGK